MDHMIKHLDQLGDGNNYDLWNKFPANEILVAQDRNVGYGIRERFVNFASVAPAISGTTAGFTGGHAYYVDTATSACFIKQLSEAGGGVRFATGATANHEAWLQAGGLHGAPFVISDANPKTLIFETCLRFGSIADSKAAWFAGMAEEGLAAANTIADTTGALADKDYIGFHRAYADGDALDFVYRLAGQTAVVKAADLLGSMAINTWYRIGFKFQVSPGAIRIIPWVADVAKPANAITATEIAVATGSAFPDGEEMNVLLGGKTVAAEAHTMDVRWYDVAQVA